MAFEKLLYPHWLGHFNDTHEWCQKYDGDATQKTPAPNSKVALIPVSLGSPLEMVAVYIIGPFPEGKTSNVNILVAGA